LLLLTFSMKLCFPKIFPYKYFVSEILYN
jgi:hypothetical protein